MRKNTLINMDLTELDVKIILEALGLKQQLLQNARMSGRAIEVLIERIYRALGVRLEK